MTQRPRLADPVAAAETTAAETAAAEMAAPAWAAEWPRPAFDAAHRLPLMRVRARVMRAGRAYP